MYLQILEDSTNRLLQTITDYMDISLLTSNTQTVNPVKIDPAGLMQEITEKYSVRCAKKSLEFTLLLPEEMKDVTIETDRTLLTKAIRHLLDNAVKFTLQGKVTAGFAKSNNTITIFVTDTGVGISPDMKHAVFNNFVQEHTSTNRSYEGSGLGLSIVKKIAELLNYELHVESSKNVGTSVFLTLPLTEGQTKSVQEPTENTGFTITKKPLVLIVDDDQYSLTLLGSILPLLNIEFVKAHNGKQAV
jgi:signal transduction histidine kinase